MLLGCLGCLLLKRDQEEPPVLSVAENRLAPVFAIHQVVGRSQVLQPELSGHRAGAEGARQQSASSEGIRSEPATFAETNPN